MSILRRHAESLHASGIPATVRRARGYESVLRDDAGGERLEALGYRGLTLWDDRRPGLLIPLLDVRGKAWGYQYRPDRPRLDPMKTRRSGVDKFVKYEFPRGQAARLDFPPGMRSRLHDPRTPLIVTEGCKKADAAAAAGWPAVNVLSVNCWGTPGARDDWTRYVRIATRDIYIAFDSDVVTKPEVQAQERKLAAFLSDGGARVRLCRLRPTPTGDKVGLDDYLAAGGDVAELLDAARPAGSAA